MIYELDPATATFRPASPPWVSVAAGSGPRHFTFHPTKPFAYLINELSSTVIGFAHQAETGSLYEIQTISTLPENFSDQSTTAEVVIDPTGRFLYGSNRGHDSIAVFAIELETGHLTPVHHQSTLGRTPRNFVVDSGGRFLLAANQDTDDIFVFSIDPATGRLSPTGSSLSVSKPVCLRMVED